MNDRRTGAVVTGANGFIGAAVTRALTEAGIHVTAVTRSAAASHPRVRPIRIDRYEALRDMPDVMARARIVFHFADCADRKRHNASNQHRSADLVRNLADACVRAAVPRFVVASSIYVDQPRSAYGRSKQAAEQALMDVAAGFEAALALRLPPVYGLGSRGMFAALARHVAAGHPLPIGLATKPRRFLGITNLCDLACHLATAEALESGVYAPADPEPVSLKTLASLIGAAIARTPLLLPVPFVDVLSRDTTVDPATVAKQNRDAIERQLGWRAPWRTAEQLDYLS